MPPSKRPKSITIDGATYFIGDTVTLRAPDEQNDDFVARIGDVGMRKNKVEVMVQWYYRPEDAIGGRKGFHGERELFLSDHKDWVAPDSINDKCQVHTLKQYQSLHVVSDADYFCRFSYNMKKAEYRPARVPVYCVCEMPYNPDRFMVECEACTDWIHPECLRMTKAEVEVMTHFVCPDCTKRHQSEGKRGTP